MWPCGAVGRQYVHSLYDSPGSSLVPARYMAWGSGLLAFLFSFGQPFFVASLSSIKPGIANADESATLVGYDTVGYQSRPYF